MFRLLCWSVVAVCVSGCQTVLRYSRPTAPEGNFGTVRTMAVNVQTQVAQTVETAVVNGIFNGEIPVPIRVEPQLKERLEQKLTQLGYSVCAQQPCGDGQMLVMITQSEVGNEMGQNGLRSHSRISCTIKVMQANGQVPYDFNFWDRRTGSVGQAPSLVRTSLDNIVDRLAGTLQPGREWIEVPLQDDSELESGVNMLLASNWGGAIAFFTQVTTQQPQNHAAWYDLGVAWEAQGDWAQALRAYEQAASLKRSSQYLDAVEAAQRMTPSQPQVQPMPTPVQPIPLQ